MHKLTQIVGRLAESSNKQMSQATRRVGRKPVITTATVSSRHRHHRRHHERRSAAESVVTATQIRLNGSLWRHGWRAVCGRTFVGRSFDHVRATSQQASQNRTQQHCSSSSSRKSKKQLKPALPLTHAVLVGTRAILTGSRHGRPQNHIRS